MPPFMSNKTRVTSGDSDEYSIIYDLAESYNGKVYAADILEVYEIMKTVS